MDTCTNVQDMCRKEKSPEIQEGKMPPEETACGNKVREISEDGTPCCSGHEHDWRESLHCG